MPTYLPGRSHVIWCKLLEKLVNDILQIRISIVLEQFYHKRKKFLGINLCLYPLRDCVTLLSSAADFVRNFQPTKHLRPSTGKLNREVSMEEIFQVIIETNIPYFLGQEQISSCLKRLFFFLKNWTFNWLHLLFSAHRRIAAELWPSGQSFGPFQVGPGDASGKVCTPAREE